MGGCCGVVWVFWRAEAIAEREQHWLFCSLVKVCELLAWSFNAEWVLPVDITMQGRCKVAPPANVPSPAQHICVHESKHLRVRTHVLLGECIKPWVGFVCFSGCRGGKINHNQSNKPWKKKRKKSNFQSNWSKYIRIVLVKWRGKNPTQQNEQTNPSNNNQIK